MRRWLEDRRFIGIGLHRNGVASVDVSVDRVKALMDEVRAIEASPENQARRHLWQVMPPEAFQPAFIRTLPYRRPSGGKIPFVLEPALGLWAAWLGFDKRAYYTDPLTYLVAELEMKVYRARHLPDDTYIDKSFRLLIAAALEATLVGVPYHFTPEGHPWPDYLHPPVRDPEDLARLELPDFYTTGLMPTIIRLYEEMRALLDDDFLVKFPDWIMGPFGVAAELRGFDGLLVDMLQRPSFIEDLFAYIVAARLHWQAACDRYLGITRTRGLLGNDDVNTPTLSPALYREMVLPWELQLCQAYGGIFYWHSCGDASLLLADIARLPVLDLFHVGPKTDVSRAAAVFGPRGVPLEICPDPITKVQQATPDQQRRSLEALVAQIPDELSCYIKVDSLEVIRTLGEELEIIQRWLDTARDVLG